MTLSELVERYGEAEVTRWAEVGMYVRTTE